MTTYQATYTDRIRQEVAQTPDEYLPLLKEKAICPPVLA